MSIQFDLFFSFSFVLVLEYFVAKLHNIKNLSKNLLFSYTSSLQKALYTIIFYIKFIDAKKEKEMPQA